MDITSLSLCVAPLKTYRNVSPNRKNVGVWLSLEKYAGSIYYVCTGHDVTSSHIWIKLSRSSVDSSHDSKVANDS